MGKNKNILLEKYTDVAVIGAGHAGCEAALACARLGLDTTLFTVSVESIAMMPCNPSIGGSSKGHLVREVDALGGEMGKTIDRTFLQSRMLNVSKGPAVHSLRAQADKAEYTRRMRMTLESTPHLSIRQAEVAELITEPVGDPYAQEPAAASGGQSGTKKAAADPAGNAYAQEPAAMPDGEAEEQYAGSGAEENSAFPSEGAVRKRICAVRTVSGTVYHCRAVILCTGTYLNACCIYGDVRTPTGPNGLQAATHLSESLLRQGIRLRRFKTGTPARIDRRSIDFSILEEQKGDERVTPFSFETDPETVQIPQMSCYLTYTNERTHEIIRRNLDRSPLFSGKIEGTGPRYCPSIEDKVVKFPDRDRHHVFLEPEGRYTGEIYIGGMSSSLPEDVQEAMYRTVPGLENAHIVKNAYAIEYDCIDATQLKPSLEFRCIQGLFAGGQLNGSSGYEEAAAQGLMAGINAAMYIQGKDPLVLDRSEAYIGVLIDDLVTKETHEPYRMMTSRAEYRLLLRQDNADLRLTEKGWKIGLIDQERYERFLKKKEMISSEIQRVQETVIGANAMVQEFLTAHGSAPLKTSASLAELIRRPELDYGVLKEIDPGRGNVTEDAAEQINISIKYDGYIRRQLQQVKQFKRLEEKRIPEDLDYSKVPSLRIEARQKLSAIRPVSIGQAGRISGVSPADISVLLIYLSSGARTSN